MLLTVVALVVLVLVLVPLIRLWQHPLVLTYRPQGRAVDAVFGVGLAAYVLTLIVLAVVLPLALELFALIAVLATLFLLWRARPSYGTGRGLPPGSLRILSAEPWQDRNYYLKHSARFGPIWKFSNGYRPSVAILGLAQGRAFLLEHQASLRTPALPMNRFIPGGFLRFSEPAQHDKIRGIFKTAFAPTVVREADSYIHHILKDGLAGMALASARAGGRGVEPTKHLREMVLGIMSGVFFGIVPGTATFETFKRLQYIIESGTRNPLVAGRTRDALEQITQLSLAQLEESPAPGAPPEWFFSEMVAGHPEVRTDEGLLYNSYFMFEFATRDTTGLMVWLAQFLCWHPEWGNRIRAESVAGQNANAVLAKRFVLEALRMERSEYILRRTTQDIRFKDYLIPKGWQVRVCVHESHRDGDVFECPNEFDPSRFEGRQYTRDQFSPFGSYSQACLGEQLVLAVGTALVQEWATHFDWQEVEGGEAEAGAYHWRPSSRLRVRLTPLEDPLENLQAAGVEAS